MNSSSWGSPQTNQPTTTADGGTLSGYLNGANLTNDTSSNPMPLEINATLITGALNDINSSLNPTMPVSMPTLELFFAIAIPLAIVTVFLPLFILPLFTYFAKKASFPNFRNAVLWGWVTVTFILNLVYFIQNIRYRVYSTSTPEMTQDEWMLPVQILISLMGVSFVVQLFGILLWLMKALKTSNLLRSLKRKKNAKKGALG
jgi:hypothetical protein